MIETGLENVENIAEKGKMRLTSNIFFPKAFFL